MFRSPNETVSAKAAHPGAGCRRLWRTLLTARVGLALLVFAWTSFASSAASSSSDSKSKLSYNRDIRPLLSENCFFCHGPDPNKRKGKLRLDVREEALAKQAIVPGKPNESELVK